MMQIQAVLLAAGKGKRMLPLTELRPKPLQEVLGKSLLEWKLEALPDEVDEVIVVVGHQGDQIRAHFGDEWKGKRVLYAEQKELNGTAGALIAAKDFLGERFLVMMGDDLYSKADVAQLLALPWGVCVKEVHQKEMKGVMQVNDSGHFIGINEEVHFVEHGLVNTGLYMLRHDILDIPPVPIGGSSTEFGLPHTLAVIAQDTPVPLVVTNKWMQITTPEDLVHAETFIKNNFTL